MRSFIFFISLNAFEVPWNSFIVVVQEFEVDADVVIAGGVFRSNLNCFLIPSDGLSVIFLSSSIKNPNLIHTT